LQTWLSWSTGKDSAWALHVLRQTPGIEVAGLFTTCNARFGRVAMHAVRRRLLEMQAEAAALPLTVIDIPHPCSNAEYERAMGAFVDVARRSGVDAMAFGDLFLADIRAYREARLADTGIAALFPLWMRDTHTLAREMIAAGLAAHITCVDPARLPRHFAGRMFDAALLADLPPEVDPWRTASSIPASAPGRCSRFRSMCGSASSSSGMALCLPISFRWSWRMQWYEVRSPWRTTSA